jgi:hypothetical protein
LPSPSRLEIKAALDNLSSIATDLGNKLGDIDDWSKIWLMSKLMPIASDKDERIIRITSSDINDLDPEEWYIQDEVLENILNVIKDLSVAAEQASETIDSDQVEVTKRGRPVNLSLYELVQDLWHLYQTETGEDFRISYDAYDEVYTGPFFEFTQAYLNIVDPDYEISNIALGDSIRRALGKRR